jgi:hypothetical protein
MPVTEKQCVIDVLVSSIFNGWQFISTNVCTGVEACQQQRLRKSTMQACTHFEPSVSLTKPEGWPESTGRQLELMLQDLVRVLSATDQQTDEEGDDCSTVNNAKQTAVWDLSNKSS